MKTPRVYFLPKIATQLIITYLSEDVVVSILCPPHQKDIDISFVADSGSVYSSHILTEVPELCLTHYLYDERFLLHIYQNKKFSPYVFANVYDYGAICFGDVFDQSPRDLRQAWNYYWQSPFNQENSEYYDYHKGKCTGNSSHTYAGHREIPNCICACCIEICTCPCFCEQSALFNRYLTEYHSKKFKYSQELAILNNDSLILDVVSPQLVILPQKLAATLGLKEDKYPDIFLFVINEDETYYYCVVEQTQVAAPKAWFKNGTDGTTTETPGTTTETTLSTQ